MIKRIVFDFDGTIADTSELCLRCFHDAWEPHVGHKMTDEEILATYGLPEEGMIRKLMPPPWDGALNDLNCNVLRHYRITFSSDSMISPMT